MGKIRSVCATRFHSHLARAVTLVFALQELVRFGLSPTRLRVHAAAHTEFLRLELRTCRDIVNGLRISTASRASELPGAHVPLFLKFASSRDGSFSLWLELNVVHRSGFGIVVIGHNPLTVEVIEYKVPSATRASDAS